MWPNLSKSALDHSAMRHSSGFYILSLFIFNTFLFVWLKKQSDSNLISNTFSLKKGKTRFSRLPSPCVYCKLSNTGALLKEWLEHFLWSSNVCEISNFKLSSQQYFSSTFQQLLNESFSAYTRKLFVPIWGPPYIIVMAVMVVPAVQFILQ